MMATLTDRKTLEWKLFQEGAGEAVLTESCKWFGGGDPEGLSKAAAVISTRRMFPGVISTQRELQ